MPASAASPNPFQDPSQQYQEPKLAEALQIMGALVGGTSGRPLGSGLMAVGGLIDRHAADKWEQTVSRPHELNELLQRKVITPDESSYLQGLSPEQYKATREPLMKRLFPVPKQLQGPWEAQQTPQGFGYFNPATKEFSPSPGVPYKSTSGGHPSITTEYDADKKQLFRVARDPESGQELWRDPAGAIKPGAAKPTATQQFMDTPLGKLPGLTMLKRDGTPFGSPLMTVGDAAKAGGILLTDKNAASYSNSLAAEQNLDLLAQAGKQVLPATVPSTVGETARDITINPLKRYLLAKVDPRYAGYEHAKAGIITYMRDLTRVGRVNQNELNLVVDRLNNAQTYPALKSAVDMAKQILQRDRLNLAKTGELPTATAAGAPAGSSLSGAGAPMMYKGRVYQMQKSAGKWYYQDASGAWKAWPPS